MTHDRARMIAVPAGILIASAVTVSLYILVVAASFFVVMPTEAQSTVLVGGLLTLAFGLTFVITFRRLLNTR